MLPEPYRLHHRADFSRTVRRGQRTGRRDLVVHVYGYDQADGASGRSGGPADAGPMVRVGGPRFGLIVSKAVGSAVIRHRVARRLRHICAQMVDDLPAGVDVVIRALPGAAAADSAELARQCHSALRKLAPARPEPVGGSPARPGGRP